MTESRPSDNRALWRAYLVCKTPSVSIFTGSKVHFARKKTVKNNRASHRSRCSLWSRWTGAIFTCRAASLHSDWTIFSALLYLAHDFHAAKIARCFDMTSFAHLLRKRGLRDLNRDSTRFYTLCNAFNGSLTAA